MIQQGFIYEITCVITGKKYVGQTRTSIEKRWGQHVSYATKKKNTANKLANAIRKYGADAFTHCVLETCNTDQLNSQEKYWIKTLNTFENGLNLNEGGKCPVWSNETKQRFSENHPLRGKFGAEHPAFGYHHTTEAKQRIAAGAKGRKRSPKSIRQGADKICGSNNFWFGKKISSELNAKRHNPLKGRKRSEEIMANCLAAAHQANRGRHQTEDEKQRRSMSMKGKPKSEEHRRKLSEAAKNKWKNKLK